MAEIRRNPISTISTGSPPATVSDGLRSHRAIREAALVSAYAVDHGRVVSTENAADLLEAETGFRVVTESPPELVPGACDRLWFA